MDNQLRQTLKGLAFMLAGISLIQIGGVMIDIYQLPRSDLVKEIVRVFPQILGFGFICYGTEKLRQWLF